MKYLDEYINIPILDEGDKLYHYTSASGLKGICEGKFWVTECHFLNDSSEFQVGTDIFLEVLRKHIIWDDVYEELKSEILREVKQMNEPDIFDKTGAYSGNYVISFCLDEDSPLLWSEYSNFMGYCMKFDFKKLLACFQDDMLVHGKVIYDHDEQSDCIEKTLEKLFSEHFGLEDFPAWDKMNVMTLAQKKEFISWTSSACVLYNMFFKKSWFQGEREYRFVFMSIHDGGFIKPENRDIQYFRIKDEVLIPYIEKKLDDLNGLESVLIGPKNKSDIAVRGLEYFFRNLKLRVEIKKSEMPLRY